MIWEYTFQLNKIKKMRIVQSIYDAQLLPIEQN